MIRTRFRSTLGLVALCLVAAVQAQTVYGVTNENFLIKFDAGDPTNLTMKTQFTGLQANELVLGIDFRPATGELYAMGSSSRLYKIDVNTAAATAVGGQFSTLLNGVEFGFDFNPTVDRIRVVSDTGQNLRLNPITGAVAAVDIPLVYAAGDPNFGRTPRVSGSAYTNNFVGGGSTVLYNIDTDADTLVTQIPPNNGVLNTVGSLGMDAANLVGFDIIGVDTAFAALTRQGDFRTWLNRIDLTTGKATAVAPIGGTSELVRGIAVVPEPATLLTLATLGALAARRRRR